VTSSNGIRYCKYISRSHQCHWLDSISNNHENPDADTLMDLTIFVLLFKSDKIVSFSGELSNVPCN